MIGRRDFITLLGGAATAWPLAARGQQAAVPVVGWLSSGGPNNALALATLPAFRQGLGQAGYVEGRNVTIEFRWADDFYDRLPALAADLVRRSVAGIVASGIVEARAAKAATSTIPIVFLTGVDPVIAGLVASLNRPGANVTGVTLITGELEGKRLEFLRELVPKSDVIGLLVNPSNQMAASETRSVQAAVVAGGQRLQVASASNEREIEAAFEKFSQAHADAFMVAPDTYLVGRRDQIVALAARHAIPGIYNFSEFAAAGGLASYGASSMEAWRQLGAYTGRIIKGEKPSDLPVMQPTKFELLINLKTARALGLTVPDGLVLAADEVIE